MLAPSVNEDIMGWTSWAGHHELVKVVLEHPSMTDFGSIPIKALRDNSVTELNIHDCGVGIPGVLVLSHLLPAATALTSCK